MKVKNVTKDATTKFTFLASTQNSYDDRCSLLLCEPVTGRTHQIRRHAYAIGNPIIGDSQHGDSRVNRHWRENKDWDRLALHCWKLEFEFDGEEYQCIAPLSSQFQSLLLEMGLWEASIAKMPLLAIKQYDETGGTHGRHYRSRKQNCIEEESNV